MASRVRLVCMLPFSVCLFVFVCVCVCVCVCVYVRVFRVEVHPQLLGAGGGDGRLGGVCLYVCLSVCLCLPLSVDESAEANSSKRRRYFILAPKLCVAFFSPVAILPLRVPPSSLSSSSRDRLRRPRTRSGTYARTFQICVRE